MLSYAPVTKLAPGTHFLKIEILEGDAAWKGQIGSVDILHQDAIRDSAAVFYVDSQGGSDFNDGYSPETAWKSLPRLNDMECMPGDSVLLKSGQVFLGHLDISARGTPEQPIRIGKYGGDERPVIDAAGHLAGIRISNSANICISDIEITADGGQAVEPQARTKRHGIHVTADQAGEFADLRFENLNIHHIFATENVESDGQNPSSNMGMGLYIAMKNRDALISHVHIENCSISMTGHTGIRISNYTGREATPVGASHC